MQHQIIGRQVDMLTTDLNTKPKRSSDMLFLSKFTLHLFYHNTTMANNFDVNIFEKNYFNKGNFYIFVFLILYHFN